MCVCICWRSFWLDALLFVCVVFAWSLLCTLCVPICPSVQRCCSFQTAFVLLFCLRAFFAIFAFLSTNRLIYKKTHWFHSIITATVSRCTCWVDQETKYNCQFDKFFNFRRREVELAQISVFPQIAVWGLSMLRFKAALCSLKARASNGTKHIILKCVVVIFQSNSAIQQRSKVLTVMKRLSTLHSNHSPVFALSVVMPFFFPFQHFSSSHNSCHFHGTTHQHEIDESIKDENVLLSNHRIRKGRQHLFLPE